ncbi:MAG: WalW protein [Sphingobium sp.]|nr:WalW protein [Sphingobium sp.]
MNVSSGLDLLTPPARKDFISFPDDFGTRFLVVVDTEEEFDWAAPFSSDSRSVTTAHALMRAQGFFAGAGVCPLYVVDYPVIENPATAEILAGWSAEGSADVGAHCHPWVNPPHVEAVNDQNSFAGNLPEELERAKLTLLRDRLSEVIGKAPLAFRAGRYGVGRNTASILSDLGFRVDSSVRSRFDYSAHHGPNFTHMPLRPYRAGPSGQLIEMPLSTAWVGMLRSMGRHVQPLIRHGKVSAGIFARAGLLQRIPLTPEGVSPTEAVRAIDQLLADDLKLLMFGFHSPTLKPGQTPYVRSELDLGNFYRWWDVVLNHLARRGVLPARQADIINAADRG